MWGRAIVVGSNHFTALSPEMIGSFFLIKFDKGLVLTFCIGAYFLYSFDKGLGEGPGLNVS